MASGAYAKSVVRKWFKEGYQASPNYKNLPKTFKENALMIIELFADLMAEYMDSPPSCWDDEDVYYVCVETIPEKGVFERKVFEGIIPTIVSFFDYLGQDIIDRGWADELITSIKGKEAILLKNVKFVV